MKMAWWALLALMPGAAFAGDGAAEAQLSRRMMIAFVCSIFAGVAGTADEEKRLFELGISDGRAFIEAYRNGKISESVLNNEVPMLGVLALMSGPSDDFMLGRIYESVANSVFKELYPTADTRAFARAGDKPTPTDNVTAKLKYQDANCAFIR